jgi:hypothetical protein
MCYIFPRQLAQAYVVATTSAVAVAVGLNSLVKVCKTNLCVWYNHVILIPYINE